MKKEMHNKTYKKDDKPRSNTKCYAYAIFENTIYS